MAKSEALSDHLPRGTEDKYGKHDISKLISFPQNLDSFVLEYLRLLIIGSSWLTMEISLQKSCPLNFSVYCMQPFCDKICILSTTLCVRFLIRAFMEVFILSATYDSTCAHDSSLGL